MQIIQNSYKSQIYQFIPTIINNQLNKEQILNKSQNIKANIKANANQSQFISFQSSIQHLYKNIQTQILSTKFTNLQIVANHYFTKQGKLVRPSLNLLLAKHLQSNLQHQTDWASVIEILHIASLMHDDILDKAPFRRGLPSAHAKFGIKEAAYGGNYLVGRAARKIYEFNSLPIYQIYSSIMRNLTDGEYLQALKKKTIEDKQLTLQNYILKTYFKTSSLIAHSLEGVGVLSKYKDSDKLFNAGIHIGIAFQLIDDIIDYTSTTEQLGKQQMGDIIDGNLTGPFLLTYFQSSENIQKQLLDECKQGQVEEIKKKIVQNIGIELTEYWALLHIEESCKIIAELGIEDNALYWMLLELITRKT